MWAVHAAMKPPATNADNAEQAGDDRSDRPRRRLEGVSVDSRPGGDGDGAEQHEQAECRHYAGDDRAPADQVTARNVGRPISPARTSC